MGWRQSQMTAFHTFKCTLMYYIKVKIYMYDFILPSQCAVPL